VPKFLIVRFSSIGDIVLTSPVIRCLKEQVKGAEVHYLTRQTFRTVIEHDPHIDKLWTTDGSLDDVIDELEAENFDFIIDLHHNLRTFRLKRLLGAKSFSFRKLNLQKWLLVNFHINRMPAVHIVDRYMDTLKSFGVRNDGNGLHFYTAPSDADIMHRLPETHRNGYIAVAIGAQHSTKMMPSEKIGRILKALKIPAVLLGGRKDGLRAKQVQMAVGDGVWDTCGVTTLGESSELIRNARVVLTHDTGLMHIAAAFRRPVVSVWGNTVPDFGMAPYMPGDESLLRIIGVDDLKCRPCSKIGFDKCPKGHFQCMRGIDDATVVNAVKELLAAGAK